MFCCQSRLAKWNICAGQTRSFGNWTRPACTLRVGAIVLLLCRYASFPRSETRRLIRSLRRRWTNSLRLNGRLAHSRLPMPVASQPCEKDTHEAPSNLPCELMLRVAITSTASATPSRLSPHILLLLGVIHICAD